MHSVRMVVDAQSQSIRTDGGEDLYCLCRGRVCRAMYLATYAATEVISVCVPPCGPCGPYNVSIWPQFHVWTQQPIIAWSASLANEPTKVNQPRDRPNVP